MERSILIFMLIPAFLFSQENQKSDLWSHFRNFVGTWEGNGEGKWGSSSVKREYQFILGGTFLFYKNTSNYAKQERNPEGEIHDNWGFVSYDRARKKFVLRQFHAEEIVDQYVVDSAAVNRTTFEFISESIENFRTGWRAKEVYEIVGPNDFIERFYLAPPGQDFQLYVTNIFKRVL